MKTAPELLIVDDNPADVVLAREALAGRTLTEDSATLRGLSEPVRFVRVSAGETLYP